MNSAYLRVLCGTIVRDIRAVEHLADKGVGKLRLLLVEIDLHRRVAVLLDELVRFDQGVDECLVVRGFSLRNVDVV